MDDTLTDIETCSHCCNEVPDSTLVETDEGRLCEDCLDDYESAGDDPEREFERAVMLMASHANPDLAFFPSDDY